MPESPQTSQPARRPVRRAPRFAPFLLTGGLLALIFGIVMALRGESGDYSDAAAVGLFALIFTSVGVLLGAVVALVLDRRSLR